MYPPELLSSWPRFYAVLLSAWLPMWWLQPDPKHWDPLDLLSSSHNLNMFLHTYSSELQSSNSKKLDYLMLCSDFYYSFCKYNSPILPFLEQPN